MSLSSTLLHSSRLFLLATLGIFTTLAAQAQTLGSTAQLPTEEFEVTSQVTASHTGIRSGQTFNVAWQVTLAPGWHIYYSNAGDSGLPPALATAEGFTVGPLTFPTPHVIRIPPITNYGYENEVAFTAQVTAPATLKAGSTINMPVTLSFLFCKDVCLPGTIETTLPLAAGLTPTENPAFAAIADAQAQTLPHPQPEGLRATHNSKAVTLSMPASLLGANTPLFIPNADGIINDSAAQTLATTGNTSTLTIPLDIQATQAPTQLDGLLLIGPHHSYRVTLPLEDTAPPPLTSTQPPVNDTTPPAPAGGLAFNEPATSSLLIALASAFLAGLILNLMPCVLPVLALKVLGVVKGHHGGKAWHHSAAYTVGILTTFTAFALILAILKQAGMAVGWGFHLQSPYVTGGLAALMLALALNLFGVFEAGTSLTRLALASPAKSNHHLREAFLTGLLAVIVATPCTVPFMGGAMAYALTEASLLTSLLTFLTLGLGMAAPFILLTSVPALVRYIPKPGEWMVTFKQLLGWPMLATGVWLVWVCGNQTSPTTQLFVMFWLTAFAAALWLYGRHHHSRLRQMLLIIPLAGLAYTLTPATTPPNAAMWQPWSPEITAQARSQGPVFVDFTADWCITCKVTEATVLNTSQALELFAKSGTTLLKADWTRQDPAITAELGRHGRKGVPLYLLYLPGNDAEVLPQLVTFSLLEQKLSAYVR